MRLRLHELKQDWESLQPADQIHYPHVQRVGQDLERLEGDVALAAFDFADVRTVQTGLVREHVLRPALPHTQRTHVRPDLLLDGLHQKQCGASLVLSILVITSRTSVGSI